MKRKPEKPGKVEEPASPLLKAPAAKAPVRQDGSVVRYAEDTAVEAANRKIMQVHREVLRKLAQ